MTAKKKLVINGICANRKVRKMVKLNPTTMKTQYDGQYDTFCRKNHDYGNSFEESLDKFGIVSSLVRMQDKMLRLQSLTDESKTQQVGSESLLDTLEDLSNYAAMTACWLKGVQAEDDVINKSYHQVKDLIETCDDSDVKYDESFRKRMLNSLYGVRGVVMKGSRGNSNVIVMASRGSGKGFMKTKSLLEELGVPKEDIKEIFEVLEDEDDE